MTKNRDTAGDEWLAEIADKAGAWFVNANEWRRYELAWAAASRYAALQPTIVQLDSGRWTFAIPAGPRPAAVEKVLRRMPGGDEQRFTFVALSPDELAGAQT